MKNNFLKGLIMTIVAFIAAYISENTTETMNWRYVVITSLGIAVTYIAKNAMFKSVSLFGKLDLRDVLSGLILAVGTAISSFAASIIITGVINWKALGIAVITAVAGYFSKNFLSNGKGELFKKEKK